MTSTEDAFELVSDRLGRDLRTRFPGAVVRFRVDHDEQVWITVDGTTEHWGEVTTSWFADDEPYSDAEVEQLVREVTFQVAENMWPDELMDPWPLCPAHRDHPLSPDLRAGRAVWLCDLDRTTFIAVGSLPAGSA